MDDSTHSVPTAAPEAPDATLQELEAQVERDHAEAQNGSAGAASTSALGTTDAKDDADEAGVTERYTITEDLLNSLLAMGFSENAIKKSIACGCVNEESCVQWITMQLDHPELNTPLEPHIRVTVRQKRVLTEEERAAKVAELKEKIRIKKEQEAIAARENALKAERARIAMGKNAHEVKEQLEEMKRRQAQEERRKEKAADAAAREKLQIDLAVDKLVRQGKTPEEAKRIAVEQHEAKKREMEDEKRRRAEEQLAERRAEAEMRQREQQTGISGGGGGGSGWNLASVLGADQVTAEEQFARAATSSSAAAGPARPQPAATGPIVTGVDEFSPEDMGAATPEAFRALRERMASHDLSTCDGDGKARYLTAVATLQTIIRGVLQAPLDVKKRQLRLSNAAIQNRLLVVPHAVQFLRLAGFVKGVPSGNADAADAHLIMNVVVMRHLRNALAALDG